MKKLLAIFLSISSVFANFQITYAQKAISVEDEICMGLGCLSAEEYQSEAVVTRAGFAEIISGLYGFDDELEMPETGNNKETAEITPEMFDDVDLSHPSYKDIVSVCRRGYMKGISGRRFAPEYDITIIEAAKVIVDMLGYSQIAEMNGGYPEGYWKEASEIGVLNGISKPGTGVATQSDIFRMIYNSLSINIMEYEYNIPSGFSVSDKTFMEEVLNTYRIKAVMTDNGYAAIRSQSGISNTEIMVGGIIAKLPEELFNYRKLIGRKVEMYYAYNGEKDELYVKYIRDLSENNSITITADDFISYSDRGITFTEGNRVVTKSLNPNSGVIYNNSYMGTYNADVFEFDTGDITICDTTGNGYDLIIINDYDTVFVTGKNESEMLVYNGIKTEGKEENNVLDLSGTDLMKYFKIWNENGEAMTFEEIEKGDVLNMLRGQDGIEITVSRNKTENFKITSISTGLSGRAVVSDGTNEYEVLNSCYNSSDIKPLKIGSCYTLYFNRDFNVAYYETETVDTSFIGIITKVTYDEMEELGIIRMFCDDGTIKKLELADTIKINDKKMKLENWETVDLLETEMGNPVMYKKDDDGRVVSIAFAADFADPEAIHRGWHRINPISYDEDGNLEKYQYGYQDFSRFFYQSSGTKVITVPVDSADYGDERNFSVNRVSFQDSANYQVEAFASSPYSVEAEIIILRQDAKNGGTVNTQRAMLIESVSEALTGEDEPVLKITGYLMTRNDSSATYTEILLDPEAMMLCWETNGTTVGRNVADIPADEYDVAVYGPKTPRELEAGDVIRYDTKANGMVDCIAIGYDYSTKKAFNAGAQNANYGAGSTFAGYALSKDSTGIRLVSGIKPENINYRNASELRDYIKSFRIGTRPVFVVERGNKKVRIRQGNAEDVMTYTDTKASDRYDLVVALSHWTGYYCGTVIYR